MKRFRLILFLEAVFSVACLHASAQVFNGGFEGAMLSPIPSNQIGGFVAISNALPGWSAFFGNVQVSQVLQNNYSLGSANISILGPDWVDPDTPIIQGNYTALLQAGFNGQNDTGASIAQSSLVPLTAESIQMKVRPVIGPSSLSLLGVTIGGQNITMVPLSVQPNYTLMGGDISAFEGQTDELTISALSAPGYLFNSLEVDSIIFSNQAVPEPGTLALLSCGAIMVGCYGWRRRR